MTTLYTIIALLAIAGLLGLYLLTLVLQTKETPRIVAFIHGTFVAAAMIMLVDYARAQPTSPTESLTLFSIAALGGFILIYRDLSGLRIPKWLAITHSIVATLGFIFLIIYTFSGNGNG